MRGALPSAEPGLGPGAFPSTGGGAQPPPSPTARALHSGGGGVLIGGRGHFFWGGVSPYLLLPQGLQPHEAYAAAQPPGTAACSVRFPLGSCGTPPSPVPSTGNPSS